jgi:hypothetical protein
MRNMKARAGAALGMKSLRQNHSIPNREKEGVVTRLEACTATIFAINIDMRHKKHKEDRISTDVMRTTTLVNTASW